MTEDNRAEDETVERDAERRSYRGEALEGADFGGADLRGVDFTGADLRFASFVDARLGVRPQTGVAMMALAMAIAIGAGVAIGWAAEETRKRLGAEDWDQVAEGGSVGLLLVVLVALIFWKGFDVAIKVIAIVYVVVLAVNLLANLIWEEIEWGSAARATLMVVFVVLSVAAGIFGRVVGGHFGSWAIAVVAALGGLASGRVRGGVAGIVVAVSLVLISRRALRGDQRDRSLRHLAHRFVSRWGTRFVDADLTGADFSGADGSRCDVTGATLRDVRWDPDHPAMIDEDDGDRRST